MFNLKPWHLPHGVWMYWTAIVSGLQIVGQHTKKLNGSFLENSVLVLTDDLCLSLTFRSLVNQKRS